LVQDRGLGPVLPGLPVKQGRSIGNVGSGDMLLPIPTSVDEKAIRPHNRQCHPYSNIVNHLQVALSPLRPQVRCKSLLRVARLAAHNSIYSIDQRSEILVQLKAGVKVLVLLLLLMHGKDFGIVLRPSRPCIRISNPHIKD
jgi:hypothetical protein